jgi:hypothetical protein
MGEENTNTPQDKPTENLYVSATTEYVEEAPNDIPQSQQDNSEKKDKEPINVIVNLPQEAKGYKRSEMIAIWIGVAVNIILAVFTYLLFLKTVEANKTSKKPIELL